MRFFMMVNTATAIDGRPVTEYVAVVTGEAVIGTNVFRDIFAGLRDIVRSRYAGYERSVWQAREPTLGEMVAEAKGSVRLPTDTGRYLEALASLSSTFLVATRSSSATPGYVTMDTDLFLSSLD